MSPDYSWDLFEARRRALDAELVGDVPRSMAPRDPAVPVPVEVLDAVPYVELHLHSNYSLLDGASSIDELLVAAKVQGHAALALTDHEAMYGSMEFARSAKEEGLRAITGLELTVAEADGSRSHVTLLAETRQGYSHLCRLSSIAFGLFEETQDARETRRLDPVVTVEVLRDHAAGIILLTGCRDGLVPRLVQEARIAEAERALSRWVDWFGHDNVFVELQDNLVFGDRPRNRALVALADHLGVPVVGTGDVHYHEADRHRLQDVLVSIKHRKTLDESHRERRANAEFMLRTPEEQARRFASYHPEAAANSVRIARRCAFDLTQDLGYSLPASTTREGRTQIEELRTLCMERLDRKYSFGERTTAIARLERELELVELNQLAGFFLVYHEVMKLAEEVAREVRGPSRARSVTELPPGRGRGSSVASIICYLIGLSHIDPIRNRLSVDRFLNDGMRSLPDIDLDFPRDIREALIERVYVKWGKDHAALVAIFPTYRLRSAVRDIGKVLGLPEAEVDRLAKRSKPYDRASEAQREVQRQRGVSDDLVDYVSAHNAGGARAAEALTSSLSRFAGEGVRGLDVAPAASRNSAAAKDWGGTPSSPSARHKRSESPVPREREGGPLVHLDAPRSYLDTPRADDSADARALLATPNAEDRAWAILSEMSAQLAGFPRHLSQHVGGMVISSEPLIDCVPCQPARWPNRYLAHWDKDSIDDARMVKIDFLGLGMLSVVEECVDLVEHHRHRIVDLSRINMADEVVYDEICRGDTVGVFQIESRAQIAMLPRTQPRSLDDLTVQVSIVRPGPIVGGAVNPYVRRREARRRDPNHVIAMPECVRPALEETLGVVLFQDQVIEVAKRMGGFNAGEAETFRRAMSRKRSAAIMERYRQQFMDGAADRGVALDTATTMFENLLGFAEFGFPKSHGAAFGLLAYQSTWLKHYYAPEYLCALLNEQPMGFYPPHVLTKDAQRHGVAVRRPDVSLSDARCTVEEITPDDAQTGLRGVIRVGLGYVKGVGEVSARRVEDERARDGAYRSLFDFVQRTGLSQEATTNLIRIGAFDSLGLNRRELIWQLGLFHGGFEQGDLRRSKDRQMRLALPTEQDEVRLSDFNAYQRMAGDYAVLRLSPDSHPMQFLRAGLGEGVVSSRHLRDLPGGRRVDVAGLVVCRQQPMTAKGIIFLLLEDEFGMLNVLVSKELVEAQRDVVRTAPFVRVRGKLETRAGEQRTLVADTVEQCFLPQALTMPTGKSWG
ncbi:MAG: PHP domain-containing protein [Chloroflexi bacterium]|nr:PHP domain-containing protein [Chloroflexota bacterium]